jgi:hypothetical protein
MRGTSGAVPVHGLREIGTGGRAWHPRWNGRRDQTTRRQMAKPSGKRPRKNPAAGRFQPAAGERRVPGVSDRSVRGEDS